MAGIYCRIHEWERQGRLQIGWQPEIYPVRATAEAALARDDLYVYEKSGRILAAAIINRLQVDVYADCAWQYPAAEEEVMVLHTLVVEPEAMGRGIGSEFVGYYEMYARKCRCRVLRMDTNAKNTAARALYRRLGYREAGILPCSFNGIPGVDLVLLEKSLG